MSDKPKIVLVHGAWGDASHWRHVIPPLHGKGYNVSAVQNPLTALPDDIDRTSRLAAAQGGPTLLVGHSYGGVVITGAGHVANVVGLVYIAAFAPDEGETVNQIVERYPEAEVSKYMRRGPDGEWSSEHTPQYWAEIGWDVPVEQRAVWDAESRRSENAIFTQPTGVPAWRAKPAWYLVAADDKTLRPEIQRDMAARAGAVTAEVPGSHFTPRVRPAEVVTMIEQALRAR